MLHYIRTLVLLFVTSVFVSACDGTITVVENGEERIVAFEIRGDFTTNVGATATLDVVVTAGDETIIDSFEWVFADGQSFTGSTVSRSFATGGFQEFTLKAIDSDGQVLGDLSGVIVVFPGAGAPVAPIDGFPTVWGDAGENGIFELDDVLLLAQALNGNYGLTLDGAAAVDLNLSTSPDQEDLALMAQAQLRGEALPTAVLEKQANANELIRIVSPALLDPTGQLSVTIGGFESPSVTRVMLGYAAAIVPAELAAQNGTVAVVLRFNGQVVGETVLTIVPAPTSTASPREDVAAFFASASKAFTDNTNAVAQNADAFGGLDAGQLEILQQITAAVGTDFDTFVEEVNALLDAEGGDLLAEYLQFAILANGGGNFASISSSASAGLPALGLPQGPLSSAISDRCEQVVAALCNVSIITGNISTVTKWLTYACTGASVTVFLAGLAEPTPAAEAAAIAGFLKFCAPILVKMKLAITVNDVISELSQVGIALESDKTTISANEVATISAFVKFKGAANFCNVIAGQAVGKAVEKYLTQRVYQRVMQWASLKTLADVAKVVGLDVYESMRKLVEGTAGQVLSVTGVSGALTGFATTACDFILTNTVGPGIQGDTANFSLTANNGGTLMQTSNGTSELSCPDPSTQTSPLIKVSASRRLCSLQLFSTSTASVDVTCGSANVTITMGDNGSLNDDIFEIIYEGKTVLTSNSPVRSTSVTVPMPIGRNTVQMRGRAAPDGIGTYFVRFTGATVVSGQTSGSDLTPGVTKTFVIEVQ